MSSPNTFRIVETDVRNARSLNKGSSMLTIRSTEAAVSAEKLLAKIAADRRIIEGMIADYFAVDDDAFPDSNMVALSLQDAMAALDDLKSGVSHSVEMFDTRSKASVY